MTDDGPSTPGDYMQTLGQALADLVISVAWEGDQDNMRTGPQMPREDVGKLIAGAVRRLAGELDELTARLAALESKSASPKPAPPAKATPARR